MSRFWNWNSIEIMCNDCHHCEEKGSEINLISEKLNKIDHFAQLHQ